MRLNREVCSIIDQITDHEWSFMGGMVGEDDIAPDGVDVYSAQMLKIIGSFTPRAWLPFLVCQFGGPETETKVRLSLRGGEICQSEHTQ